MANEVALVKTIDATKFKEQCLSLLDNLDNEGIVVTKRGQPVAANPQITQHSQPFTAPCELDSLDGILQS